MAPPTPSSPRLVSLDVFRGATMAAMVIVNTPGSWEHAYAPLEHAEWNGWTPTDLIFPFFVFIVGVSITLSRRRAATAGVIVRRALVLYGLGFLLAFYPRFHPSTVRIMGVLPRLAICYLAAALVYRAIAVRGEAERIWTALGHAAALLVGYWALMTFVPVPGGVAGDLTPSGNLGAWIDRTVIGQPHLWVQSKTWDPEGLLSTLPAIATALTGLAAGVLLTGASSGPRKVALLVGAGLVSVALGYVWNVTFPINKNLWTSSYVLFTSGLASIALGAAHWAIDLRGPRGWTRPFVVMGTNALALFVFSGWLIKTLILIKVPGPDGKETTLYNAIYLEAFAPFGPPKATSLVFALVALCGMYVLLEVMYRRRWFLRA